MLAFYVLNAGESAIEIRHLALPGHKFNVIALDGTPVPTPAAVDVLMLGPGERIDAWVENEPARGLDPGRARVDPYVREVGLGHRHRIRHISAAPLEWTPPPKIQLGLHHLRQAADATRAYRKSWDMIFEKVPPRGAGKFNSFHGERQKSYPPRARSCMLKQASARATG